MLVCFALHFLLNLSFDTILPVDEILFFLHGSILLLLFDHHAHLLSLHRLRLLLLFQALLNCLFLQLRLVRCVALVVDRSLLLRLSFLLLLDRRLVVRLSLGLLLSFFLLSAHLFDLVGLVVPLALLEDLVSTLASFLDFFNGLILLLDSQKDLLFLLQI